LPKITLKERHDINVLRRKGTRKVVLEKANIDM